MEHDARPGAVAFAAGVAHGAIQPAIAAIRPQRIDGLKRRPIDWRLT